MYICVCVCVWKYYPTCGPHSTRSTWVMMGCDFSNSTLVAWIKKVHQPDITRPMHTPNY